MDPRRSSSPLALAVLVLLFEKDMHPYEMASLLKQRGKEQSIKLRYGSLYTVIAALQREGLISAFKTLRAGRRPERTVYRLSPAGLVEMRRRMQDILSVPVKEYPDFEAGLSLLPAVPPHEAVALLKARVQRLDERSAAMSKALSVHSKDVDPLFLIESEYQLALLNAETRFVKGLIASIEKESWPAIRTWREWQAKPRRAGGVRWKN